MPAITLLKSVPLVLAGIYAIRAVLDTAEIFPRLKKEECCQVRISRFLVNWAMAVLFLLLAVVSGR